MAFGIDDALLAGGFLSSLLGGKSTAEKQQDTQGRISIADYQARLPIRALALNRLTGPQAQRENTNDLFTAQEGNPYFDPMERPVLPPSTGGGSALLPPVTGGASLPPSVGDQYKQDVTNRAGLPGGRPGEWRTSGNGGIGGYLEMLRQQGKV